MDNETRDFPRVGPDPTLWLISHRRRWDDPYASEYVIREPRRVGGPGADDSTPGSGSLSPASRIRSPILQGDDDERALSGAAHRIRSTLNYTGWQENGPGPRWMAGKQVRGPHRRTRWAADNAGAGRVYRVPADPGPKVVERP
jgi:hypothetical protein